MEHLSQNVKRLFRFISEQNKEYIDEYFLSSITRDYKEYINIDYINNDSIYTIEELETIRKYSGYNYQHINNALRNTWNYEQNGNIQRKNKFLNDGKRLAEIITNKPTNLGNVKTYRGVNISYFKEYEINNIEELINLKGQFLLDKGFVSTSLNEETCFFKKENDLGMNYNVKITYLIPEEFEDGIFLHGDMCYNEEQNEYLINTSNIAKVVDVKINENDTAHITAMMIPKIIYDEYYANLSTNKTKQNKITIN